MPPDLPTRLARKCVQDWEEYGAIYADLRLYVAAAVREAARKWHNYGLMHGALVAVAKAAHELIQLRESGSHPGSGGDPAALKRLHTLQDALAHPAVQRAVKEQS